MVNTKFQRSDLKYAVLKNIKSFGLELTGADLSHADLTNANLEQADFRGSNLSYVNLRDAELTQAFFRYAILNKTRFSRSYIQHAIFSPKDIHEFNNKKLQTLFNNLEQEQKIDKETIEHIKNNIKSQLDENRYEKAAQIYRELKNTYHQNGIYDWESDYHYRERRSFTIHLRKHKVYGSWAAHGLFKILCGFGEKWWFPLIWIFSIIISFGFLYFILGGPSGEISNPFYDSFYFSGVTFTTLGFGDLYPSSGHVAMRILAMVEALFGALFMALFVVVVSKRIFR